MMGNEASSMPQRLGPGYFWYYHRKENALQRSHIIFCHLNILMAVGVWNPLAIVELWVEILRNTDNFSVLVINLTQARVIRGEGTSMERPACASREMMPVRM